MCEVLASVCAAIANFDQTSAPSFFVFRLHHPTPHPIPPYLIPPDPVVLALQVLASVFAAIANFDQTSVPRFFVFCLHPAPPHPLHPPPHPTPVVSNPLWWRPACAPPSVFISPPCPSPPCAIPPPSISYTHPILSHLTSVVSNSWYSRFRCWPACAPPSPTSPRTRRTWLSSRITAWCPCWPSSRKRWVRSGKISEPLTQATLYLSGGRGKCSSAESLK